MRIARRCTSGVVRPSHQRAALWRVRHEAHGRPLMAELFGGRLESVGEEALVVAMALALLNTVAAIVEGERHDGTETRGEA